VDGATVSTTAFSPRRRGRPDRVRRTRDWYGRDSTVDVAAMTISYPSEPLVTTWETEPPHW